MGGSKVDAENEWASFVDWECRVLNIQVWWGNGHPDSSFELLIKADQCAASG